MKNMNKNESFIKKEYGLTGLPFKTKIAIDLELQSWINREKEMESWNKILENAIKIPNSNFFAFIIGDYGLGKTLSLLKIVKEPIKKELYPIYFNMISEQKPKNPGLDFILRIIRQIDFDSLKVTKKDIEFIKSVFHDVGNVFEKILFPKDNNEKILAMAFIKGEIKPNQSQMKLMEVIKKIDDVDIAKEYLTGILHLIKISGFSTLVVAVDEFEYLFSLIPKPSQSIYLALFRGLYDFHVQIPEKLKNVIANMAFFFGISEDGMQRLNELENIEKSYGGPIRPLMRRIEDKIRLSALDKKYVRELIEKRLSLNRVKGMYEKEPLIPFTEDFVEYIFKLTAGKPAFIIERCDHVLEKGLVKRAPKLTAEFAIEVFKERGFTY